MKEIGNSLKMSQFLKVYQDDNSTRGVVRYTVGANEPSVYTRKQRKQS